MSDKNDARRIYIIAGEASGDLIGANLIKALNLKTNNRYIFRGMGGCQMLHARCDIAFSYHDIAIIGFIEIIPRIKKIMILMKKMIQDIDLYQPNIIITIDSPGFNFRLVRKLRKHGYNKKIIHYVAPTVWAYGAKRIKTVQSLYDYIFLLFRFETNYFKNIRHTFVGHPLAEITEQKKGDLEKVYNKGKIKIAVMPGSRQGEITRHMKILMEVMQKLRDDSSLANGVDFCWYFLVNKTHKAKIKQILLKNLSSNKSSNLRKIQYHIIDNVDLKRKALTKCDLGLIKAGTAVLESAYFSLPTIAFYKINIISALILKYKLKIKYLTLVNIILKKNAIPELLQQNCNSNKMIFWIKKMILQETLVQNQLNDFAKIRNYIKQPEKPSFIAARTIDAMFEEMS